MSNYRRSRQSGGTFFFTVVTAQRKPLLTQAHVRSALRASIQQVRQQSPFTIEAWVLLPDHLHCLWTLPENDNDYSRRWGDIERLTSRALGITNTSRDSGLWQRRFWEHHIRDERDLQHHTEYIFINPVKHGLCKRVSEWPYSSFHQYVKRGIYPPDWATDTTFTNDFGE